MSRERKPRFGDRLRGVQASKDNPLREGIYVETVRRAEGPFYKATYYRLTDGRGRFWEYPRDAVAFVNVDFGGWRGATLHESELGDGRKRCQHWYYDGVGVAQCEVAWGHEHPHEAVGFPEWMDGEAVDRVGIPRYVPQWEAEQ